MNELDDGQAAELEQLRATAEAAEPGLAAAIDGYNAAVRAAYERFLELTAEYQHAEGDFEIFHTDIVAALMDHAGAAGDAWQEGDEGRAYLRWLDAWIGAVPAPTTFERPRELKVPEPPLSALIAALPHRPGAGPAGRPIDPGLAAAVAESWRRIDAWLAEHAPTLVGRMNPGATPRAIARAEAALGVELPAAVRASYLIHDGSGIMSLFPSGDYLSLAGMLDQYGVWKELIAEGLFEEDEGKPKGPIRRVHYHPRWIPLTHNGGGDHTLIDLAPAEGGAVGQLIDYNHETGPEVVAAPGLAEYLAYLAAGLEAGAATDANGRYLDWTRGEESRRSAYAPIPPRPEAPGSPAPRHFEFTDGTSSKFWEVSVAGDAMTTRWGKIGTQGQSKTKSFAGPAPAAAELARAVARKLREGYVER